ncbi:hypothetical protein [Phreatobacter sp.]|uniref:hypothetical protein n=1 Tax=Phreatobacter sp. TaxID=1966341 RepID=UPI003F70CCE3
MTNETKARMVANAAFLNIQSKNLTRDRILTDIQVAADARDDNMHKLRQLRMERDTRARHAARAAPAKVAPARTRKHTGG